MSDEPAVLCTICARGGSKGIPDKNVREVGGKPLIAHSIDQANAWDQATRVVVSTDSDEIASVARSYGADVPFRRPEELASDEAAKLPAIKHALEETEAGDHRTYDYVVDLDATAPLRTVSDIEGCFREVTRKDADNAYTVYEADKNPYFNMVELGGEGYAMLSKGDEEDVVRRQDAPNVYAMNASVYVYERDFLIRTDSIHGERTRVYEMPPDRSVDIDRELDLQFVEFLMDRRAEE